MNMNSTKQVNDVGTSATTIRQRPRAPNYNRDNTNIRIVILGMSGVGKTALTVRYITKRYIGEYCPTLESIHTFQTNVDHEDVRLEILDTAGQMTDTGCVWRDYYAIWGDCFIFVYAINDKSSFDEILHFKRRLESTRRTALCALLVGNKSDLLHDRQVSTGEALELSYKMDCKYFEISAADWTQVDIITDMFHGAVRECRRTKLPRDIRCRRPSSSTRFKQAIQKVISGKSVNKRNTSQAL